MPYISILAETAIDPVVLSLMGAIGILSGAVVKVWYDLRGGMAKQIESLIERVKHLEKDNDVLGDRCLLLERENQRLITQFVILSSSHDSSPLPQWIKDEKGKVLAVNRAYEAFYLTPRGYRIEDYLHNTDHAVWPDDIAEEYQANDQDVWRTRRITDLLETIETNDGKRTSVRIIKFPRYMQGAEQPVGIAGIAIPEKL